MNARDVLKVLLVDEGPEDRREILKYLRTKFSEIEARHVTDRDEFVAALHNGPVDIVITELQLGWTSGMAIRSDVKSAYPNCPVLMVTRHGKEEVAVAAMKAGFDDYIVKNPSDLARLPQAVNAALNGSTSHERAEQLIDLTSLLSRLGIGFFRCGFDGTLLESDATFRRLLSFGSVTDATHKWAELVEALGIDFHAVDQKSQDGRPAEIEVPPHVLGEASAMRRILATRGHRTARRPIIEGVIRELPVQKSDEPAKQTGDFAAQSLSVLTSRERQVFDAVVAGHPNKVTARQLHITEKTVEKHRARIMKKLGARSLADLVRLALGHRF